MRNRNFECADLLGKSRKIVLEFHMGRCACDSMGVKREEVV
jgi:hypothetical protein